MKITITLEDIPKTENGDDVRISIDFGKQLKDVTDEEKESGSVNILNEFLSLPRFQPALKE